MLAGQQFRAGCGLSTVYPSLDWETYSEAGYVWDAGAQKWASPRGCGPSVRGLKAVGAYNYVNHPTFEVLSLAYDLLDGRGVRHWVPRMTEFGLADEPHDLIAHVARGGILAAFNVAFERRVWGDYCVKVWGWPEWPLENSRCDMDKGKVSAYPPSLEAVGELLLPAHLQKDKAGHALVRKLTVPKNPSKARANKSALVNQHGQAQLWPAVPDMTPTPEEIEYDRQRAEDDERERRKEAAQQIGELALETIERAHGITL